ncbi:rhodanese-like domain-containing protein [Caldibacillus lycopersici]|uniref:Rhodanese-like domain-containing protein n=1 Tax=Perspicuibacillus lycopersici TaxID=1325689 RepID=A0AAE3IVJ3_9BACI|nr:rhodanese-like domain-containing protein [Perspicuibacillus lycopersici]MCU9615002.1 rhodanese-like domain-containing protein [Perspicuibacillus lycopersici]
MDIIQWIIIILIALFVIRHFLPTKGITTISIEQTKNKFKDKNVQFIDVRTPGEYKANHRQQFKNIPLSNLLSKLDQLDKNKEIVVICQSGMRSSKAAKLLKRQGFEKIYNVKGGMSAWV